MPNTSQLIKKLFLTSLLVTPAITLATPIPTSVSPPFQIQCDLTQSGFPCDFGTSNFASFLGDGYIYSGLPGKGTFQLISAQEEPDTPITYTYEQIDSATKKPMGSTVTFGALTFGPDSLSDAPSPDTSDKAWTKRIGPAGATYNCTPTSSDTCPITNLLDTTNQQQLGTTGTQNIHKLLIQNDMGTNGPGIAVYATSVRAPGVYANEGYAYASIPASDEENPAKPTAILDTDNSLSASYYTHDSQQYTRLHLEGCTTGKQDIFLKNFVYTTPNSTHSGGYASSLSVSCNGKRYIIKPQSDCQMNNSASCTLAFLPATAQNSHFNSGKKGSVLLYENKSK